MFLFEPAIKALPKLCRNLSPGCNSSQMDPDEEFHASSGGMDSALLVRVTLSNVNY